MSERGTCILVSQIVSVGSRALFIAHSPLQTHTPLHGVYYSCADHTHRRARPTAAPTHRVPRPVANTHTHALSKRKKLTAAPQNALISRLNVRQRQPATPSMLAHVQTRATPQITASSPTLPSQVAHVLNLRATPLGDRRFTRAGAA